MVVRTNGCEGQNGPGPPWSLEVGSCIIKVTVVAQIERERKRPCPSDVGVSYWLQIGGASYVIGCYGVSLAESLE